MVICNYLQLIQVSIQNSSVDRPFRGFFLSGDYFMYMLDFCESVCNLKINTKQYNYKFGKTKMIKQYLFITLEVFMF